ncbi:biotin-dependent carboxyltransferase family protein [Ancylobacter dichloromethanicus]|uniref:Allophanate hydrolase n=1 Tax=Ancylobacter dichloromethanicus TaxID=518825 RepID=A0A9W6N0L7_9HYPH|nr:biotin-dependent carboxyltransferase family protein [Ancylobacter dichloromethanicus]MBS7552195.1 biotin-dependent carboxyltransferase family protein [Ancylobacter dichloromethanicus]GLK73929.1 allophanate hydrolase [Ancylobacter dichloromethanicus]
MSTVLHMLQPGPQTTVQDLGRHGFQAYGVPVCGALDGTALRLANALVGNEAGLAGLEVRLAGPTFEVAGGPARLALAGAQADIEVIVADETSRYGAWRAIDVPEGARVRIGALTGSGGAMLAFAGGLAVPAVLGSRATDLKGRFGGHEGRPLAPGDRLPLGTRAVQGPCLEIPSPPRAVGEIVLRAVPGPQADAFTDEAMAAFFTTSYRVSREADRMGMRLEGPPLAFRDGADIVSDGIATGSIQVPGSGLPIVLLADHQTIGGYAKIATVISADLPLAGSLMPGAQIRFRAVTVAEGEDACRAREAEIARIIASLAPVREGARIDAAALYGANLISGVVTALESG